jgi:small multidrug resistance pump
MNLGAWGLLALAILLEVAATSVLKLSDGFQKPFLGMLSIGLYSACFWAFAPVLKVIPLGVAYAIWAGTGIALVAVIGAFFFGQRLEPTHYAFIAMIGVGAIGLRLTTAA